jgi:hypothetical protein
MATVIVTYCNSCQGDKNHNRLFTKKTRDQFDDTDEEYSVVECMGCNTVSFLKISVPKKKSEEPLHYNYPQGFLNIKGFYDFLSDDHQDELPGVIYDLYEEVIHAFNGDAAILAGIGLRTLVEAVCLDQNISGSNLQQKIQGLNKKGFISSAELPILDKLRIIGNVSAHEIKSLSMEKLELALGIINHMLRSVYVLPKLNKRLKLK